MQKGLLCLLFIVFCVAAGHAQRSRAALAATNPEAIFLHPPESAKPGMLWMWMGSNLSKTGITKDLEAMQQAGYNRTTMFSLADITTPWAGEIRKSPTPKLVSWTELWWQLVRHAALESKRLGMDFGMFNGPSYESSGGKWITPELSMQEVCWSVDTVAGGVSSIHLPRPTVNPRANQLFPIYNPETGLVEKPVIEARKTYYKDIAVLALPLQGTVAVNQVQNLTAGLQPDGTLNWVAPAGNWAIYRFGHTTRGTLIQPAQWAAAGLECDKMNQQAVDFHLNHVIGEIQSHLGDLIGTGFTHVHFDSYEAGYSTWTPKMTEEFAKRRGYELTAYLPILTGHHLFSQTDSARFMKDFDATIKDLYRDVYFKTIAAKLKAAHLQFLCEPYGGPWRQNEILPLIPHVMTEFWTNGGKYRPYELEETVAALRTSGQNIIEAEAFTGDPADSKWDETPEWLKPIGDAAFCAGVNRLVLHRFVQQPWDSRYLPGATMGRWGTHFDRTQTWWKPGKALAQYWQRCQALLQWGRFVSADSSSVEITTKDSIEVKSIHRRRGKTDIYFVANSSRRKGQATCSFGVSGLQPECWDPVTAERKLLPQFTQQAGTTSIILDFDKAQSFFIVFRKKPVLATVAKQSNNPAYKLLQPLQNPWKVTFDSNWGGPKQPVIFDTLHDWTQQANSGIRYYSGTAVYTTHFNIDGFTMTKNGQLLYLQLGVVKHIAAVKLNGISLGVVWTAPWQVQVPARLLKPKNNRLEIEVTNVWANRLIGDEQEPDDCTWLPAHNSSGKFLKEFPDWFLQQQPRPSKGRYCFTTWNYFTATSPLISSGLLGPVRLAVVDNNTN